MKLPSTVITAFVLITSFASAQIMTLADADRRSEPIIDAATPETKLAVNQLVMPEGIKASLWAAEPLLANPVAFAFDEQGRLFVSETHRYRTSSLDIRHYMDMLEIDLASRTIEDRARMIEELFGAQASEFEIESEVVRLVEDRDGDGRAEFSSVYADEFNSSLDGIASGVLARKGKVYFTNIPNLWQLEGMSEQGNAKAKTIMHSGFGVHFGYTGHDFHGLALGPDAKLYFSIGDRGASLVDDHGDRLDFPDMGAVYRCNLDGSELEVVHWGLRNPQELAFDELGNLFTGDNDCDNGDYERIVQIVKGGDTGWRIGHQFGPIRPGGAWISEGWWKMQSEERVKFALPPICYIEDGPSGIAYYPGTGLSPDYRGHLFVTHFKGSITTSGVYSYKLKPKGATFELEERGAFLKGVVPTDVTFGPDGKFYVLDWVSGWPKSNKGRVYALWEPKHQASDIVKETQRIIADGMTERETAELGKLLSHPNWNVRLEAQLELANRGQDSIDLLTTIAQDDSKDLYARLHGAWGLGVLAERGSEIAKQEIRSLARSRTDEVRAQAIKLLGDHKIEEEYDLLVSSLDDDNARARFFAAQSLAELGKPESASALIKLARSNDGEDPYIAHAVVMGLVGADNRAVLSKAVTDESAAVRAAALLAYRRLGDAEIGRFLGDSDKHLVFEAARAINDQFIVGAYPALAEAISSELANDPILGQRALNAHFRIGASDNAKALVAYAASNESPEDLKIEAIRYLSNWGEPPARDRVNGLYRPLDKRDATPAAQALASAAAEILEEGSGTLQAELIAASRALEIDSIRDPLYSLVLDETKEGIARAAAFNALHEQKDPRMDELVKLASQSNVSELRLASLPIVAERSPEEAETTLALIVEGSMEEQRIAFDTLAKTEQAFASRLLVESLDRLARNEVPLAAQLELLEATENDTRPDVMAAYQAYEEAVANDPDPVAAYQFALEGGDPRRGYRVFNYNQTMPCLRCHLFDGPGDAAGPNLADVGLRLDRRQLLESIVDPNAAKAEGFDNVIITLKDGSSKFGVVTSEDAEQIVLQAPDKSLEEIVKQEIANKTSMPSTMPAIFTQALSKQELRDLVEFLARRDQDPNARASHGE